MVLMNTIHSQTLEKANEAAIYNLYLYLAQKTTPADQESFRSIVAGLETASENWQTPDWNDRDIRRLRLLRNAIASNLSLADSRIGNLTRSKSGLTACSFTAPNGDVSVIFKGTGSGEWIDNGEGLSGIPEENTYMTYGNNGEVISFKSVPFDYASDQQVQALNWFRRIAAQNGWNSHTRITLSGHSKGGNKAQFVAVHSDLADACYSFDGQGFSPEALAAFEAQYGSAFEARRQNILSISTDNDYVNVLGKRLMPQDHVYYLESSMGYHYPESMLDHNGRFRPQCEQGKLSRYVEMVSAELMDMNPFVRQYAALGIMNIFQKYLGSGTPVNGDKVSIEKTIAGIGVAIVPFLHHLHEMDFRYKRSIL